MSWDPKVYLKFDAERTRPAAELLARVHVEKPRRVIDLGCGPGNSTALLAQRWPEAALEGLDNSPDMLKKAAETGIRATWIESDISGWRPAQNYDVIYANAAFQWVPEHEMLLPRLMEALAEGGTLAFQVPRNFDEPCHMLLLGLAGEPEWRDQLKGARENFTIHDAQETYDILDEHAARLDVWETTYTQVLEGDDAVFQWMSGTGARPYLNALKGEHREAFIAEYKTRLAHAYPMRASGKTLFAFRRLFAVAEK